MRRISLKLNMYLFLGLCLGWVGYCQTLNIDRLKANYLVAFTEFARWDGKLETANMTIGFFGSKELARDLRSITHNKFKGRPIKILKMKKGETDRLYYIDIIFASSGSTKQWYAIKERCKEYNRLVIGEQSEFIEEG